MTARKAEADKKPSRLQNKPRRDPANVVGEARHAVKSPETLERILQCFQLRKGGASYRNIAQNLHIAESDACNYVLDEMRRLNEQVQEAALEHRQMQLERLNDMLMSYWPRRADTKFGQMILNLMNKMDSLLGIESQKIDLTVKKNEYESLTPEELDNFLMSRLHALEKPKPINVQG